MGSGFGESMGQTVFVFFVICLILAAFVGIGLWELGQFIYHHLSFSWK